jgi:hypothetical protein
LRKCVASVVLNTSHAQAPPSALLCVVLLLAASCCDAVALGAPLLSAAAAMLWARRAHAQWAAQCPDHHFVAKDGTFVDTGTATPWTATLSSGVTYSGDSLSMSSGFVSFGCERARVVAIAARLRVLTATRCSLPPQHHHDWEPLFDGLPIQGDGLGRLHSHL